MTIVVPNVAEVEILTRFLTQNDVTLCLFSNNVIPGEADTLSTYTEVTGGGYVSYLLDKTVWTIAPGDPSTASYPYHDFAFTGPTGAPGTVYGYFVKYSSLLLWAERFPEAVLPFSPTVGSLIRTTPQLQCA